MAETRILVATDGSEHGTRAVDLAAELSAGLGEGLTILHVLMHGRPAAELERMAEIEHLVEEAAPRAEIPRTDIPGSFGRVLGGPGPDDRAARLIAAVGDAIVARAATRAEGAAAQDIRTRVVQGDHADAIVDAAADEGARMIVVGRRGLGRFRGAVLGSVSQKLLHQAPCTVVAVT
ncbi:universal stress protein [Rhodosalinus sp.]|uniref:universal stress protein n=1 Tax=Rhodosalinus sp. TaxID=2047741 RepID=UPI0035660703